MNERMPANFNIVPDNPEHLSQKNETEEKVFLERLTDLVGGVYAERLAKKVEAGKATVNEVELLLKDNLDHVSQVKDNVDFIIDEIKAGRIADSFIPKDENGQAVFDNKLLKTMTVLHDIAKIDEKGELDTFHHHDKDKVEKILVNKESKINEFLENSGFTPEETVLMVDGIAKHSRRTDFIARYFDNRKRQEIDDLPRPEGVLEYIILSDADILTQSRLEQGVKKIICSRLVNDFFRQIDTINGRHSFAKSLESVVDSARKVSEAMHFYLTKQKALEQLRQVLNFESWLKQNNKIAEIDDTEDFNLKKKKFDEFIQEFLELEKYKH